MTLCIPITAATLAEALQEISLACRIGDFIELRLDYLLDLSEKGIEQMIKSSSKPVIATYRKKKPIPVLKAALAAGAEYVDVEQISDALPLDKCIYSIHLPSTPSLEPLYRSMKACGAAVVKIIPTAHSFRDNLAIFRLLEKFSNDRLIAFCTGEKGIISRYYATAYGSFCTFAALAKGKESAAGQPIAAHLKKWAISCRTKLCGVIGDPIAHSLSPHFHQRAYAENGLDFFFHPFRVKKNELADIIELMRQFPLRGLAVTLPHKEAVIPFLDEIHPEAAAIGAVNTLVNQNGALIGYNTDILGALNPLKKRTHLKGKRVLILGAGGAAKAFIYGLQKEGAVVTVLCRNPGKSSFQTHPLDCLEQELKNSEILIQTTCVGMAPHTEESLVPFEWLHQDLIVFDCVYTPKETRLLRDAGARGCQTISGFEMFTAQAIAQHKLFTKEASTLQ